MSNTCNCFWPREHAKWCITQSPNGIRARIDESTKEMRDAMRAAYCNVKPGDIVTGIDRSYTRSIYKIINIEMYPFADAELISYDGRVAEMDIKEHFNKTGITLRNVWTLMIDQYRIATQQEIDKSAGMECECGKEKHGFMRHSPWCKLFE